MYVPTLNQVDDGNRQIAFMREYNFGVLVTSSHGGDTVATHLPFTIANRNGTTLVLGHLARANPQCDAIADVIANGRESLVIFQGPHAYVSPAWYERHPSVPTWNYQALHAYGSVRARNDPDQKREILRGLIEAHDGEYLTRFEALPAEYLTLKLAGIFAFEVQISRIEARFKLSQDRTPSEQANIAAHLNATGRCSDAELASAMQQRADHARS